MNLFVVVAFLDRAIETNFLRNTWPLHLTLQGNFYTDANEHELSLILTKVAERTSHFTVVGRVNKSFGSSGDVLVVELSKTNELLQLHNQLVHSFGPDIKFEIPSFNVAGYKPHVTNQLKARIRVGEERKITTLSLVKLDAVSAQVCSTIDFLTT